MEGVVSGGFVVRALFFSAAIPCAQIGASLPFLAAIVENPILTVSGELTLVFAD